MFKSDLNVDTSIVRVMPLVGLKRRVRRRTSRWHTLAFILAAFALLIVFPRSLPAMDVTLQWDANPVTEEVIGYRVYYKVDSAGERNLDSYDGQGLVLVEESGTARKVDSGFEILVNELPNPNAPTVSCRLSGLASSRIYFFVVTAFSDEGVSLPSREVATDDTPPTKPTNLSSLPLPVPSPCSSDRDVSFQWSPSTDPDTGPAPGSGLAGYSFVFDAFPDTTPDAVPILSGVTEITLYAPTDGYYWFHIRAVDKGGVEGANGSETEHYGPICIDTGPPGVVHAFIDYVNSVLYVEYSERTMQNASLQSNYSSDNGLLMLGDGTDVYGDGKAFSFPLESASLNRYLIYTLTIVQNADTNITDCAGNPVPTDQQTIIINDDDGDGMADEWERLWFGGSWLKDGSEDSDGDGLTDLDEYLCASLHPELGESRWTLSPLDTDSDHDGIPDGYEIENGLNPTDASDRDLPADGGSLTNYDEYVASVLAPGIETILDSSMVERAFYNGPTPVLTKGSPPVTWSLVSGPSGMEIDLITGQVYWPEPTLDGSPYTIRIRAENRTTPSLYDEKTWQLTVVPYQITIYVNASLGEDLSGEGKGSAEQPWKSIGFALSETQGSLSPLVTIRVAASRYDENIVVPRSGIELEGSWNSDFSQRWDFVQKGLNPLPEYETVIEGQNDEHNPRSVIVAASDTTIDGFTISGGNAVNGGGISGCEGLTVSNCKIIGNSAELGGGMYADAPVSVTRSLFLHNRAKSGGGFYIGNGDRYSVGISACTFRGNSADTGGGIFIANASPHMENCLFAGNTSSGAAPDPAGGGGIANKSSSPEIVNCTFSGNRASEYGGAIWNFGGGIPLVKNCILWGNTAEGLGNEIYNDSESAASISYCDIDGSGGSGSKWDTQIGTDLNGNIDADPLFVDPLSLDHHLRYLSPCMDAGDPSSDFSKEPEPNGGRINMGAYGGTSEAMATQTDTDRDGLVNIVEDAIGTDSVDPDRDQDGISEGEEVLLYPTDPINPDTDGDGIPDKYEIGHGLNPADPSDRNLDLDNDGWTNYEEYVAGYAANNANSPVPAPPQVKEVIPAGGGPIPSNSVFAIRLEATQGINLSEPSSVTVMVNDGTTTYRRNLNDTNGISKVIVKAIPLDSGATTSKNLWIAYYRSNETAMGNEYPLGATVTVTFEATDIRKDSMTPRTFGFRIQTAAEEQEEADSLPHTVTLQNTPTPGFTTSEVTETASPLQGAAIIYDSSLPGNTGIIPYFGPTENIPVLDVSGYTAVGVAMDLMPPSVFPNGVTVVAPCPGYADVSGLYLYYYNGQEWVMACDPNGNVQPGGVGWMVPGSRVNHNGNPSWIEIEVYHFSAAIAATRSATAVTVESGGGGGGCFIDSLMF